MICQTVQFFEQVHFPSSCSLAKESLFTISPTLTSSASTSSMFIYLFNHKVICFLCTMLFFFITQYQIRLFHHLLTFVLTLIIDCGSFFALTISGIFNLKFCPRIGSKSFQETLPLFSLSDAQQLTAYKSAELQEFKFTQTCLSIAVFFINVTFSIVHVFSRYS